MGPAGPHGCRLDLEISELNELNNTITTMAWAILFHEIIVCTIECWRAGAGHLPFCYYCEFPTQVHGIDYVRTASSESLALRMQILLDNIRVFGLEIVGSFLACLVMNLRTWQSARSHMDELLLSE